MAGLAWALVSKVPPFVAGLLVGALEDLKDTVVGIVEMVWGLIKGIFTGSIFSDIKAFFSAIWELVKHPVVALKAIWGEIKEKWEAGWYSRGKLIGAVVMEVVLALLSFGVLSSEKLAAWMLKLWDILKATKAGPVLAKVEEVAAVARKGGGKVVEALSSATKKAKSKVVTTAAKVLESGGEVTAEFVRFVKRFMERVKRLAQVVFEKFGFKDIVVEEDGEWIKVYGIRSKILIARFRRGSLRRFEHDDALLDGLAEQRAKLLSEARNLDAQAAEARRVGDRRLAQELEDEAAHVRGGAASRATEKLGEEGAILALKEMFPDAELIFRGSGSGTVDLVFDFGDGLVGVVEAKGGGAVAGTRAVGRGVRAEQGTITYLRSVLKEMRSGGDESLAISERCEAALAKGKLRYHLAKTKPGRDGGIATLVLETRR